MKQLLLALMVCAFAWAAPPSPQVQVELINSTSFALCDESCLDVYSTGRTLKISVQDEALVTGYLIQIVTPGADNSRRTHTWVIFKTLMRFGESDATDRTKAATFFSIPLDADLPILDIWVTALETSGDSAHLGPTAQSTVSRYK